MKFVKMQENTFSSSDVYLTNFFCVCLKISLPPLQKRGFVGVSWLHAG